MTSTATNYLNEETSIRSWLLTTDHKRIGLLYLFTILIFFFIAASAAGDDARSNCSRRRAT